MITQEVLPHELSQNEHCYKGRIKPSIFGKILCFFGFHRWHFWGAAQHHVCIRMEDYNGARESIRGNWVTCIRGDCLAFEFERGD